DRAARARVHSGRQRPGVPGLRRPHGRRRRRAGGEGLRRVHGARRPRDRGADGADRPQEAVAVGRDRWSAAGLALLAIGYLFAARRYPLDTLTTPGPGIAPLGSGLALLALAVWLFIVAGRSEEHTSELQSRFDLVC